MKKKIRMLIYAIILVNLLTLPSESILSTAVRTVYDVRGKEIGRLYRYSTYEALRRLSDGRIEIRYSGKIGYLKPATR